MTGPAEVVVLAKRPRAGHVKTRLSPPYTPAAAARLAAAALRDTLDTVDALPAGVVRVLSTDGDPGAWLRAGWRSRPQVPGGLDRRLADAIGRASGPVVVVGMDTPQCTTGDLLAFDPSSADACLGPAVDGGFWLLGLRDPERAAAALHGVPMSVSWTFEAQYERLTGMGLRVQVLRPLVDVDTAADADRVARQAPAGGFARAVARARRDAA